MSARADWQGSILLAGFPVPVALHTILGERRGISFRRLDPKYKEPVRQVQLDRDNNEVKIADCLKGVETINNGQFHALTNEELASIEGAGRSTALEVERYSDPDTVQFEYSFTTYAIVPNPKVPGSEASVQQFWNGLRYADKVAVIPDFAPKANSRPSTLVVRAADDGLYGYMLPYESELRDHPTFTPVENEQAGALVAQFIAASNNADFELGAYTDTYVVKRNQVIEAVLTGQKLETPIETTPTAQTPDLMAALEASLKTATKKPAAKRAPAKKKVSA